MEEGSEVEVETERCEQNMREVEMREAEMREAEMREVERRHVERREVERRDAERREAERRDAERREAERKDVERREAEMRETEKMFEEEEQRYRVVRAERMKERAVIERLRIEEIEEVFQDWIDRCVICKAEGREGQEANSSKWMGYRVKHRNREGFEQTWRVLEEVEFERFSGYMKCWAPYL
jgi:hypothetical protein